MSSTAPELREHDVPTELSAVGEGGLRIAHYSVYPRTARNHAIHAGYTRNLPSGVHFVLAATSSEQVGELLRVHLQELWGHDAHDTLARVVSCRQIAENRFELGLEALEARRARKVS